MEPALAAHIEGLKQTYGDPIPRSWSADFEDDPYRHDPDRIIAEALACLNATRPAGSDSQPFVNLVTPGELGDPQGYLVPAIRRVLGDAVQFADAGQCDCGGYVLRAWRRT